MTRKTTFSEKDMLQCWVAGRTQNYESFEDWFNHYNHKNIDHLYTENDVKKISWEARNFYKEHSSTPFSHIRESFNKWFNKIKQS